jgi:hypothetical protein
VSKVIVEKLDVRTYKVSDGETAYVPRPMREGAYRRSMFLQGDEEQDANVVSEALKEVEILGYAVMALAR